MAVQFLMDLSMLTLLLLFNMNWISYLYLSSFYVLFFIKIEALFTIGMNITRYK